MAADDRLRAPEPDAVRGPGRRPDHRPRAAARRCAGCTTSSASRRCGRTRSCATTSASTARSTASRCTTSAASTGSTTRCSSSACGRSSSCPTCRTTWRPTRAKTVFAYDGIISPPRDWDRWADLVTALTAHLVDRYGLDEVRDRWSFEVWNEANLDVFWSGTEEEYLRLYDVTVAAVRKVDERLVVGGPSSAAAQWVESLLVHAEESGAPVDFLSTHTYGSPPLDLRPILARHGREDAKIWWTEWGPGSQHFHLVGRQRVRRDVPDRRDGVEHGPAGVALALGRLGPLRGARPAAEAQPRRLRPADGRQPAQAALVGAVPAGAPRRVAARGVGGRATAPTVSCRPSRPRTATASGCWCGTAAWTSRGSRTTSCWPATSP